MFLRSGPLLVLAVTVMALLTVPASAGERIHRHHGVHRIYVRNKISIVNRPTIVNVARQMDRRRRVDTYSGDIAVYSRRGVGTWSYGAESGPIESRDFATHSKIIDLSLAKSDCSMENGVCVIRP